MSKVKLQEILDQAIEAPTYTEISQTTEAYVKELKEEAVLEQPDDLLLQMAKELGTMRARYAHDLAMLVGHITEINKLSNKI